MKLFACYNSHSQYEQKLRTASALPIDLFGLTSIQLEVSRSFTTWITGSWLQPCGPVTRTSDSWPTARSWGHWNQKFSHGNGLSKTNFRSCFLLLRSWCFSKFHRKTCEKSPTSQKLLFRLLRSCVLPLSLPPLPLSSPSKLHSCPSQPTRALIVQKITTSVGGLTSTIPASDSRKETFNHCPPAMTIQ